MAEKVLFVPECHVDTALTHVLLADRRRFVNHHQGISKVTKVLQAQAALNHPRFVIGVVDGDKKFDQNKYLRQFTHLFQARAGFGVACRYRIFQHPEHSSHFLIVLDPACDRWIFEAAEAAGLNLARFSLPTTLPDFVQVMKEEDAENNPDLIDLLQAIKREQPPAYRELAEFVAEIMDTSSRLWR